MRSRAAQTATATRPSDRRTPRRQQGGLPQDDRPPLLIIGNELDHTVPASVSREAAKRLGKSAAVVDYEEFAGRPHFAGAPGWEAVADYALDWAADHTGATAPA